MNSLGTFSHSGLGAASTDFSTQLSGHRSFKPKSFGADGFRKSILDISLLFSLNFSLPAQEFTFSFRMRFHYISPLRTGRS